MQERKFQGIMGLALGLTDKQIQIVTRRMYRNKQKTFEWLEKSFLSGEMKEANRGVGKAGLIGCLLLLQQALPVPSMSEQSLLQISRAEQF